MKTTWTKYLPLLPVLAGYFLLFSVGENLEGKWQLIAMLAFYCALGQAFNLFMGMTGYVDFGYVAFPGSARTGWPSPYPACSTRGWGFGSS